MVAQQTATATRKPTTRLQASRASPGRQQGPVHLQSERYTYLLYAVDVAQGTCECESGPRAFKGVKKLGGVCKHLYICRQYHAHRLAYLVATTTRPATGDVAASVAPVPAFIPAPPAFSELFAA